MWFREREMRPLVSQWLRDQGLIPIWEVQTVHLCDIIGVQFEERTGRRIPELLRTIAIELKLSDIGGVLRQAQNNQYRCDESWAAMPSDLCRSMRGATLLRFENAGVGLLSVGDVDITIIRPAKFDKVIVSEAFKKNLWRRTIRDGALSEVTK